MKGKEKGDEVEVAVVLVIERVLKLFFNPKATIRREI